jgi:hypothetical protein
MNPLATLPAAKPYFADPQYTRAFLRHRNSLTGGIDATASISKDRDPSAGEPYSLDLEPRPSN